jgi:hypothetical protein
MMAATTNAVSVQPVENRDLDALTRARPGRASSITAELCEIVREWRVARSARARTEHGSHAWANAEVAVRFWRDEFRDVRDRDRGAA